MAQQRENSTKSLISQAVPVGWGDRRHVVAGKSADAKMAVGWRDRMPVSDNSPVNVAQQSEIPSPSASRAAAEKLFEEGEKLSNQGTAESLRAAIEKYFQALPLFRAAGDKRGQATTLYNMGVVYQSLGEKQTAVNYYSQALLLYRALGDREKEAGTIYMIGVVYHSLGEKQKALDYYNQVLSLIRALGDRRP